MKRFFCFFILIEFIVFAILGIHLFYKSKKTNITYWDEITTKEENYLFSAQKAPEEIELFPHQYLKLPLSSKENNVIQGNNHFIMGENHRRDDRYAKSIVEHKKALEIFKSTKCKVGIIYVYTALAENYKTLAKKEEAQSFYKKALLEYPEYLNNEIEAIIFRGRAQVEKTKFFTTENLDKSFSLFKMSNDIIGVASIYLLYGNLYRMQGSLGIAEEYYKKSLKIYKKEKNQFGLSQVFRQLGHLYRIQWKFSEAKKYYEKAVKIALSIGQSRLSAKCYRGMADLCVLERDFSHAKILYENALEIFNSVGDVKGKGECLFGLGVLYRNKFDTKKSKPFLLSAKEIFEKIEEPIWKNMTNLALADIAYMEKDYLGSKKIAQGVISLGKKLYDKMTTGQAHILLGRISKKFNKYTEAMKHTHAATLLFNESEHGYYLARSYYLKASLYYFFNVNFVLAHKILEDASQIMREFKAPIIQNHLSSLIRREADINRQWGNYQKSEELYLKALQLSLKDDYLSKSKAYLGIGLLNRSVGKHKAAKAYFEKALLNAKKTSSQKMILRTKIAYSLAEYDLGSFFDVDQTFKNLLEETKHIKCNTTKIDALIAYSKLKMRNLDLSQAQTSLKNAENLASLSDNTPRKGLILRGQGKILNLLNIPEKAGDKLRKAYYFSKVNQTKFNEIYSLVELIKFEMNSGSIKSANLYLNILKKSMQDKNIFFHKEFINYSTMIIKFEQGDYTQLKSIVLENENLLYKLPKSKNKLIVLELLAFSYWMKNDLIRAKDFFSQALKLSEELNFPREAIFIVMNLIKLNLAMKDFEDALKNIKTLERYEKKIKKRRNLSDYFWGIYYIKKKHPQKALDHLKRNLSHFPDECPFKQKGQIFEAIGKSYKLKKSYIEAIKSYEKAYEIYSKLDRDRKKGIVLYKIAKIHSKLKESFSVINELEQYRKEAHNNNNFLGELKSLLFMKKVYQNPHNYNQRICVLYQKLKNENVDLPKSLASEVISLINLEDCKIRYI